MPPPARGALAVVGAPAQSVLDPQGPVAETIAGLWWLMAWGATAVLALVMGMLLYALLRRRREARRPAGELWLIVGGGLLLPTVVLTALLVHGTGAGERLLRQDGEAMRIEVTGHQWWWQVRYPGTGATTANEIHLPAGRTIEFVVTSGDVIHSFWVPQLGGKIDMIPGRDNRLRLQADAPGRFRGQCSEFCGAQHARMALHVVARQPDAFAAWLRAQAEPAREPGSPALQRGRALFFEHGCDRCHTIRGTAAAGSDGPDLTHVGSRSHLAAGTLTNTQDHRVRWIRHGQQLKPGNRMDDFSELPLDEAEAIARYLGSLE